jgi:predicted DNA-binding transcriptional regulator AlpA
MDRVMTQDLEISAAEAVPPRLLDRDQIAAMFGVHRREVWDLATRPGFPVPVGYFRGRTLWDADEVTACAERGVSGEAAGMAEVAS